MIFLFFGPPDIASLKKKGDISGLIKALDYQKDPAVRKQAVEALADNSRLRFSEAMAYVLCTVVSQSVMKKMRGEETLTCMWVDSTGFVNGKAPSIFL